MLKGFWLCLKRLPKPELVVFACVAVLVYAFGKAVDNYVTDKAVEIYENTHSVSKESLEVVLCPMPRVYGLRLTHFGQSLPKFFNKLLYDELAIPFMTKLEAGLRKKNPRLFRGVKKHGALKCLEKYRAYKPTYPLPYLLDRIVNVFWCHLRGSLFMVPFRDALEDGTMIKRFLDKYFGTLDEMLLEEYPGLLDQAWVLPYDNLTIEQMLDYVGVNLKRYIDEDMLRSSVHDMTGPSQTLEESLIDTRMAPNCFRHLFSRNENQGYQKSKIVYQFRKSCPKEPVGTLLSKAPCLETADMYITMYITAFNQFTDVPAASVIVPYRVAADENTLVHVSAVKRIHKKQCKNYGQEESQVTCIEDCLYEKMTSENQTSLDEESSEGKMRCRVPWIDRIKQRSNRTVNLPLCHTKEELKSTIQTIRETFDIAESSECSARCPRHCHQLTITPRLAGGARTPPSRSARLPRHPRLEVLISDTLPVFSEAQQYDLGKMIAEMLGNLSFLVGVSLVALYDWLIGLLLWLFGKLPFVPAMPPLIKNEIYTREACSCAETEEERRRQSIRDTMDESETFLAASFRHHRRASMLRSFNPHEGTHARRRRAMTLNRFPTIAVRSSAMDTVARTFPSEELLAQQRRSRHSSVDRELSRVDGEASSGQALSREEVGVRRQSEGVTMPVASRRSVQPSQRDVTKTVQWETAEQRSVISVAAEPGRGSAVGVTGTRPSSEVQKNISSRKISSSRVAPAPAVQPSRVKQADAALPSLVPPPPPPRGLPSVTARPRGSVTFDLEDVEGVLGRSASGGLSDAPADRTAEGQERPQYRSRPLRPRTVRRSPSHDRTDRQQ